jgi:hypothetical protein
MQLDLSSPVTAADGPYGELVDVVIDPLARRVTHLGVAPPHRHDLARLVAIGHAHPTDPSATELLLDMTVAQLEALEPIQRSAYLRLGEAPVEDPEWQVGIEEILALPYYGSLAPGGLGAGIAPPGLDEHITEVYDRVPKDKIEIRRSSPVVSSDEHRLGHVDGFVVGADDLISHLLLEQGHLWGKHEVTIPIDAVAEIRNDEVVLNLSKDDVERLEPVPVRRWPSST